MNILLVEDDEIKCSQIISFLSNSLPSPQIYTARSFQSGLKMIIAGGLDLILLDMTIPTFDVSQEEDGGRPQAFGGREILRQMDRRDIHIPVIVVTQYDSFGKEADILTLKELDEELFRDHPNNYLGAVYYNVTFEGWEEALGEKILRLTS